MRYLIITTAKQVFASEWYDYENNYDEGMIIVDLLKAVYTTDGHTWQDIEEDHL